MGTNLAKENKKLKELVRRFKKLSEHIRSIGQEGYMLDENDDSMLEDLIKQAESVL